MKHLVVLYALICTTMIATSLVTGRRATVKTGNPHYLLTRTTVLMEKKVEPENEIDAELDALFEEAGETSLMTVEEPMFVLGFLDATGPVVAGGAVVLGMVAVVRRLRRPRSALGTKTAD